MLKLLFYQCLICTLLFVGTINVLAAEYVPAYAITKRSKNAKIEAGIAVFKFTFHKPDAKKLKSSSGISVYANGVYHALETDTLGIAKLTLKAGKYKFHVSTFEYEEIVIDTITALSQEKIEIKIEFELDHEPRPVKKPVIYVYAPEPTKVTIELNVIGNLDFSYPAYQNGWDFTANATGEINMQNKTYNYLFWEGSDFLFLGLSKKIVSGYAVKSDTLVDFLEHSLTQMGFTSKEQQDFITFWAPQMKNHERNFIHFVFNQDCDKLAQLNINPKPQNIFRMSMVWSPMENSSPIQFTKQVFPAIDRNGLTVIEWGGVELEKNWNLSIGHTK